jgi:hypothetical protein
MHRVEKPHERVEGARQRQQAQRMSRRCRVEDNACVCRLVENFSEDQYREDLVGAGQRGVDEPVDVILVEVGAAVENQGDRLAPLRQEFLAQPRGVERPGIQVVAQVLRTSRARDGQPELRQKRGRRVGRDDQGIVALGREMSGKIRRQGRLSDSALADDERDRRQGRDHARVESHSVSSGPFATRTGPPATDLPSFSRQARTSRRRAMMTASWSTYSSSSISPSSSFIWRAMKSCFTVVSSVSSSSTIFMT